MLKDANLTIENQGQNQNYLDECRAFSYWPYGRAVYINEDKTFKLKVNDIDHLVIISEMYKTEYSFLLIISTDPWNWERNANSCFYCSCKFIELFKK